jgi:gamma-glutamyl hydrolase
VVPIPYDASPENITFILNQVNGVLFIGGAPNLTESDPTTGEIKATNLTVAASYIFEHVLETNVRGEHVPITGTCLGMEVLAIAISQDLNILWSNFSHINTPSNVKFLPDTAQSSLWSTVPKELQDYVQNNNGLYFNHNFGVAPSVFQSNSRLNALMKITTIGTPVKGGSDFVASAEGREYPIYINQYHPEKPAFEWKKSVNAPHKAESIEVGQFMINHFVNEARNNNRKFVSDKVLENSLIYNWVPLRKTKSFEQVYLFRTVLQDPKSWPGLFQTTN